MFHDIGMELLRKDNMLNNRSQSIMIGKGETGKKKGGCCGGGKKDK